MWNANLYDRFNKERIQPSVDLVSRLDGGYHHILDVGCGTGMSSLVLRNRYPKARIVGADRSQEMLDKAKELDINVQWVRRDCGESLKDLGEFDLIFSNAFMHWLPDQEKFVREIGDNMHSESVLAIQIPLFSSMEIAKIIDQTAAEYEPGTFEGIWNCLYHSVQEYYDMFSQYYGGVTLWQTEYIHQFDDSDRIVDFVKGTALIPYLERLSADEQVDFTERLRTQARKTYPTSRNGMVLFPFKRLFLIAVKPHTCRTI